MLEKDINYLFNEVPLYVKEIFDVFKSDNDFYCYNKGEHLRLLNYIGTKQDKMISYCHKCKKEFPFDISINNYGETLTHDMPGGTLIVTNKLSDLQGAISLFNSGLFGMNEKIPKAMFLETNISYIIYEFKCANNELHNYMLMISIELKEGKIIVRKLGQNPSLLTIKGYDFDKYKKHLVKFNAYDDYKKADMSNSEHFYVGAYAYLRRIFEKMINYYLGDTKLKDNHIDTKIDAVKEQFDPRTRSLLKNLYGILSISIHELDENQSKEYYSFLKAVIDMQLEFVKSESDKDNQSKDLNTILSTIANLVKK